MGKRADRAKAKAGDVADDTVEGIRSTAYTVVDGAEEVFGKAKRQTKKARKHVDEIADKAEKRIAKMRKQTDRKAKKIRKRAQKQIDKATKKLPADPILTGGRMADDLQATLDALVGAPVGGGGRAVAPDPVNQPMIRHWAAAFEDANPVYVDPDAAAASRHGQVVAPPLMLQTWTMATPKLTGIGERGGNARRVGGHRRAVGRLDRRPGSRRPWRRTRSSRSSATSTSARWSPARPSSSRSPRRSDPPRAAATSSPGSPPGPTRRARWSAASGSGS